MRYRYFTCDVFTEARFGGNPLAVLPHAAGLSGRRMQRIAREFNARVASVGLPFVIAGLAHRAGRRDGSPEHA